MRSYYAHLETTMGIKTNEVTPRPTFRSSAIFPVIQRAQIQTRVIFMGYWFLKRNIKEVAAVVTLRETGGTPIVRQNISLIESKGYRFEVSDLLQCVGISPKEDFTGTLELEFFSSQNLVFPFPAVTINYYGPKFSTAVHTAQRIYNDFDDMRANSQTDVPESGFNIHVEKDREPFIAMINGAQEVSDGKLHLTFYNTDGDTLEAKLDLGTLRPYELKWIYPAQIVDLNNFLKGKVGTVKASFNVNWIFPRLIVGNLDHRLPALVITHSYYDCTKAVADSNYWRPTEAGWYPASLMIPLVLDKEHFTNVYFYPIYSPGNFTIDVEIYDAKGKLLGKKEGVLTFIQEKSSFHTINYKKLCEELKIPGHHFLATRIIARNEIGERIPARIKLAFDIGNQGCRLPCNICTNLQPFNPQIENKLRTFRWSPILNDQPVSYFWIMNSSQAIEYTKEAEVELTIYREQDTETLKRNIKIPPHGFYILNPEIDLEIQNFLKGTIGWVTAISSCPYTTTYYFAENSGVVGGDHGF